MSGSIVFVDKPNAIHVVNVASAGFSFDGSIANPTISLQRGLTYSFNVESPGHPFRIISNTTAAFLQDSYNQHSDCISCVTNTDAVTGIVVFDVPVNPTAVTVGYRCTLHPISKWLGNCYIPH